MIVAHQFSPSLWVKSTKLGTLLKWNPRPQKLKRFW